MRILIDGKNDDRPNSRFPILNAPVFPFVTDIPAILNGEPPVGYPGREKKNIK